MEVSNKNPQKSSMLLKKKLKTSWTDVEYDEQKIKAFGKRKMMISVQEYIALHFHIQHISQYDMFISGRPHPIT